MYPKSTVIVCVLGMSIVAAGCAVKASSAKEPASPAPLTVSIINAKGETIGAAQLKQLQHGVQVDVAVSGVTPGLHGIHIHEMAKCEAPDFKTAGGHFNPDGKKHGFDNGLGPHTGDMPNLIAGTDGMAKAQFVMTAANLQKDSPKSLLRGGGTSLMIHENADDMRTDPTGNSGNRIACGVIQ